MEIEDKVVKVKLGGVITDEFKRCENEVKGEAGGGCEVRGELEKGMDVLGEVQLEGKVKFEEVVQEMN